MTEENYDLRLQQTIWYAGRNQHGGEHLCIPTNFYYRLRPVTTLLFNFQSQKFSELNKQQF